MGEILPDGTHQSGYATICPRCRAQATVNMQGQGRCEECRLELPSGPLPNNPRNEKTVEVEG